VSIGPAQILSRVRFGVAEGEIVALVGTNGAGKTTTLLTLAGVLCPTRKKGVVLNGCDATGTRPEERVALGVVTMPGGRGVFPSLTVEENLRLAAWVARRRRVEGRDVHLSVEDLFPRLGERRHVKAGMLSGGEQQMLALALALSCAPSVLMIDELSLGLAPMVVAELLGVVRRLSDSGVAVIVVEQSVPVVASLAHRAVVMDRGQVRFNGSPALLAGHDGILRSSLSTRPSPGDDGGDGHRRDGHRRDGHGSTYGPVAGAASPAAAGAASPTATAAGAASSDVAVRVRAVSKRFGGVAALSDVSFELAPGEVLGLIGSNGAGKTTILDICSGFVRPDRGSVELFGRDITRCPPSVRARSGLGRTFQDARLFPSMTVAETIATACERCVPVRDPLLSTVWTRSVKDSEQEVYRRVDSLLVDMALEPYRDRFVAELSTGVRRIVELACALAHRPRVLLLDEPASGVSHEEVDGLVELLHTLRARTGIALLVIEHDVPLVAAVADRLLCLHLGEVIAEGSPAAVLSSAPVLSSFLGDGVLVGAGATTG
jgi:branched-chain amino acid transport system ATP-binding protein